MPKKDEQSKEEIKDYGEDAESISDRSGFDKSNILSS